MEIQDRRVKRTQHLLARALIVLTLEKGYETVTIRDITERADVGYATFFRHYHDKDELLKDVLDVVLTEIIDLLGSTQPAADPTTIGVLLFRYVQQQSEHTFLPDSVVPLEIAAHHIVASSISLIQWWLDHQMPYTPERMGVIYHELIIRPTSELAFSS